jgi:hypothetical protein
MNNAFSTYGQNTGPLVVITFYQQWGSGNDQECLDFNDSLGVLYPSVAGSQGESFISQCPFVQSYTEYDIVAPNREIVELNISPYSNSLMTLLQQYVQTGIVNQDFSEFCSFSLYPNPATDILHLDFSVMEPCFLRIAVYDFNGKLLKSLTAEHVSNGNHSLVWSCTDSSGSPVGNGIYFVRIEAGGTVSSRMITLVN